MNISFIDSQLLIFVQLLLIYIKIFFTNFRLPLHYACQDGRYEVVELMVTKMRHRKDVLSTEDEEGNIQACHDVQCTLK